MSAKTRYLQLSDTTMMEYIVNETVISNSQDMYIYTKLLDGHYAVFSPMSKEISYADGKYIKKSTADIETINTIAHTAVPADGKGSENYIFLNNDYQYTGIDTYTKLESESVIIQEYSKYLVSPDGSDENILYFNTDDSAGYDRVRLYFVSGYDFSDIYAAMMRISVPRCDGEFLDLCNFVYTKGTAYKFVEFMTKPIIFGNFIYDKYIEIRIPSIRNFHKIRMGDTTLGDILLNGPADKAASSTNLKLIFSYIDESDVKISDAQIGNSGSSEKITYSGVNCIFSRTNSVKGTVPTQTMTSDNLGLYIAENPDSGFLEFYGTWKGSPLSSDVISNFNRTVKLYDRTYVKQETTYEVSKDYVPGENLKQWVAVHEITSELLDTDLNVHKSDTYSMTQVFTRDNTETIRFYYRPVFFEDSSLSIKDKVLHINYLMRLINIEDGVQFVKQGSLSLTDLNKFRANLNRISVSTNPYKVINKIIENKQEIISQSNINSLKSKYVKVFYNSTQIMLDENGAAYDNGTYTLQLSRAPKNYKFIFKQRDFNNNVKYFDLSDSYYKLYVKESNGNEIVIDPTYSNNMNLGIGELEFTLNVNTINKLREVNPEDRYISIITYNTDGSMSTMYDMKYTI